MSSQVAMPVDLLKAGPNIFFFFFNIIIVVGVGIIIILK